MTTLSHHRSCWATNQQRGSPFCRLLLQLFFLVVITASLSDGLIWEDEDTEIIEARSDDVRTGGAGHGENRGQRQFPGFPGNFPAAPGWPAGIFGGGIFGQRPTSKPALVTPAKPGQCKTMLGEEGVCKTMRDCYPVLYYSEDSNDLKSVRNPALFDLYQAASSPCHGPSVINHLYFSADAEVRQSMICCPQKKPWLPPSGTKFSTTTTTRRPPIPSWPPRPGPVQGGPGGHRPPSRRPMTTTTTSRPTTTSQRRTTTYTSTMAPVSTTSPPFIESSCGQSLIVGGSEVPLQQGGPGMYPWMASMVVGRRHVCGGSLIDSRHVLTAAHCVAFMQPHDVAQIRVLLGDHDLSTVSETQHVVKRVKSLARHRGFTQATLQHDIALLILDSDVVTSHLTNIRPICLTNGTRRYDLGNTEGVVAGWGSTQFQGNPVSIMRHVTMRIWTNSECRNKYGSLAKGGISDGQVCAGSPGRDACRGDSGGPLMVRTGHTYEQVGLVSWGIECGTYPGVYTRVDKYRDWIEKNRQRR